MGCLYICCSPALPRSSWWIFADNGVAAKPSLTNEKTAWQSSNMMESESSADEFRILVATDNHLGYVENHGERGHDSFITFEEILQLACEQQADFILLGGDLFHENKPSRYAVIECSRLIKKYCFGDRPVSFEYVSDPSQNFASLRDPMVNFHDTNLNVSMPVFSIHGNHDDISGLGDTTALEMLSVTGLVNYFGRWTDLTSVTVSPVLLTKGNTKLALYGLGNIRDERLYRLFRSAQVKMLRPKESTEDWFNVFVLHQNRTKHGPTSYIPVSFLDDFIDLVIWGHEHENRLVPEWEEVRQLYISQPGSSVATSLCEGEARPKAVGLLRVAGKKFMMEPLPLRSVRPLLFRTLRLDDVASLKYADSVEAEEYLHAYVEDLLKEARKQLTGHPRQPELPLVRVRVDFENEALAVQTVRFGQHYVNKVANPEDLLVMRREMPGRTRVSTDGTAMDGIAREEEERIEDFVAKYFAEVDQQSAGLHVLNERVMACTVKHCVDKDEVSVIERAVQHQMEKAVAALEDRSLLEISDKSVQAELVGIREERAQRKMDVSTTGAGDDTKGTALQPLEVVDSEEEEWEVKLAGGVTKTTKARSKPAAPTEFTIDSSDASEDGDDGDVVMEPPPATTSARGRGRGRGRARARGGRGTGQSRAAPTSRARAAAAAKKTPVAISDYFRPSAAEEESPVRPQRRSPGGSAARRSSPRALSTSSQTSSQRQSARSARAATGRRGVIFDSDSD